MSLLNYLQPPHTQPIIPDMRKQATELNVQEPELVRWLNLTRMSRSLWEKIEDCVAEDLASEEDYRVFEHNLKYLLFNQLRGVFGVEKFAYQDMFEFIVQVRDEFQAQIRTASLYKGDSSLKDSIGESLDLTSFQVMDKTISFSLEKMPIYLSVVSKGMITSLFEILFISAGWPIDRINRFFVENYWLATAREANEKVIGMVGPEAIQAIAKKFATSDLETCLVVGEDVINTGTTLRSILTRVIELLPQELLAEMTEEDFFCRVVIITQNQRLSYRGRNAANVHYWETSDHMTGIRQIFTL